MDDWPYSQQDHDDAACIGGILLVSFAIFIVATFILGVI